MPLSRSTIHAALLLFPLFCAKPIPAQGKPHHPCFEQPNDARDAIHRLPNLARYWLVEDAVYIITPEERCAFLHLNTDHEREQFIEQFWYRRTAEDSDFETEHYRRLVFANEKYRGQLAGGGQLAGWKTDRGRIYVLFGPPDSVDLVTKEQQVRQPTETQTLTSTLPIDGTTVTSTALGKMWNFTLSSWPATGTMRSRHRTNFCSNSPTCIPTFSRCHSPR